MSPSVLDEPRARAAQEPDIQKEGVIPGVLATTTTASCDEVVGNDDVGPVEGKQLGNEHRAVGS